MNLDINSTLMLQNASQENAVQSAARKAKALAASQKEAISDKDMKKFDAVSKDFEAMFMTEMLKPMFAELKPDPRFGGGKGEEVFSGMMLQEYGKMMAETGSLGIADSVKKQLVQMQGEIEAGGRESMNAQIAASNNNEQPKDLTDIINEITNEEQINETR